MTGTQDTEELKPCPFCGESNAIINETRFHLKQMVYAVACRTRECHGAIFTLGFGLFPSEAKAIAAWNRRPDSPVTVMVEALAVRDAAAAKCPIQRGYKDICPRCKATSSDSCGLITGADYAFVETAREALARISR